MPTMPLGYMRAYRARLAEMSHTRVYIAPRYTPPRIRHEYKVRERHVFSGVVFRMTSFSGNPNLCLRIER